MKPGDKAEIRCTYGRAEFHGFKVVVCRPSQAGEEVRSRAGHYTANRAPPELPCWVVDSNAHEEFPRIIAEQHLRSIDAEEFQREVSANLPNFISGL
jgi:hypothetical protein